MTLYQIFSKSITTTYTQLNHLWRLKPYVHSLIVFIFNYLIFESQETVGSTVDTADLEEEKELDFSVLNANLDSEPSFSFPTVHEIPAPSSTQSLRKRKLVDYSEITHDDVSVDTSDLGPKTDVSDHDYVMRKKQRLASTAVVAEPVIEVIITNDDDEDSFVTPSMPTSSKRSKTKYRERRDKNNEASRRSRQIRKDKYKLMDLEADELEVKNEALRKKIVEMEAMAKIMKDMLIQKMAK